MYDYVNLFRSYMVCVYLLVSTMIPKYIEFPKNLPNSQSSPFFHISYGEAMHL